MKWIIFKLKRLFAKENAGCFNCKWHKKDVPGVWMSEECHHKDNLYKYTQTDYRTGKKKEIKRWTKTPYELNYKVDCPWFKSKSEPSLYGNGNFEEDLNRAFVFGYVPKYGDIEIIENGVKKWAKKEFKIKSKKKGKKK